jgi:hypothetical protein
LRLRPVGDAAHHVARDALAAEGRLDLERVQHGDIAVERAEPDAGRAVLEARDERRARRGARAITARRSVPIPASRQICFCKASGGQQSNSDDGRGFSAMKLGAR